MTEIEAQGDQNTVENKLGVRLGVKHGEEVGTHL